MTAAPPKGLRTALAVYRVFAWLTGVGLVLLMIFWTQKLYLSYIVSAPQSEIAEVQKPLTIIGITHGNLYMVYVVCTLVLAERCRWRPLKALLVALAGTVPLASFVAERKVTREVQAVTAASTVDA
jgi:integral membrane protein